jgi:hypothetical protein
VAELDDFFRDGRRAMEPFMRDLVRGAFAYARTLDQLSRAMDIDRRYSILGLVERSVVHPTDPDRS